MTSAAELGLAPPEDAGRQNTLGRLGLRPPAAPQETAGDGPGFLERMWRGLTGRDASPAGRVGMGMADPAYGAYQITARMPPYSPTAMISPSEEIAFGVDSPEQRRASGAAADTTIAEREQRYQQGRQAAGGSKLDTDWYRLLGNVASPVNLALGGAAGRAGAGMGAMGRIGMAGGAGAAGGALDPAPNVKSEGDFWSQKGGQALGGTLGGAGLAGAGAAAGRTLAPVLDSARRTLLGRGVELTPGQALPGPKGMLRGLEERFQGFPILGSFISNARERSLTSFNAATINQALEPIGASLPTKTPAGSDAMAIAWRAASTAYDEVLGRIKTGVASDAQLRIDLAAIAARAQRDPDVWRRFEPTLREDIERPFANRRALIPSRDIKQIMSELGREAREYGRSESAVDRALGAQFGRLREALGDAIRRQHPNEAPALDKADETWAMLTRIGAASIRRAGGGGMFTPLDLLTAIRSQAGGVNRREYQKGDALMQGWADAAQRVMAGRTPDSGTAGRTAALLGGFDAWLHPEHIPAMLGAAAGTGALYSRPGTAAARAFAQPGTVRRAVGRGVEGGAVAAAPGAGSSAARRSEDSRKRHRETRPSAVGP